MWVSLLDEVPEMLVVDGNKDLDSRGRGRCPGNNH